MNFFARSDGVPTAAFFFAHYDEKELDKTYNGGVFIQAVAASAAEVEDPKNDFDEYDDNKNKINKIYIKNKFKKILFWRIPAMN